MKKFSISICFAFAFFWGYSQIIPVTLYTTKDAYTISSDLTNYGNATNMDVGITLNKFSVASFRRSFVEIPLSGIPNDAIITSAVLKFYQNSGLTASSSTELYLKRLVTSWDESTINSGLEPTESTTEIVTSSTYLNNWRSFDVKTHVQKMVNGSYANQGWLIHYYNESQTTANVYKFQTSDDANDPKLEISYYIPLKVTSVVFNHCASTSSNDGTITPTFANGCGAAYTYQWVDSAGITVGTGASLSGVPYGWYGLYAYNATYGDYFYMAFLLGVKCQNVSISFNPGPNYIDDSYLSNHTTGINTNHGTIISNPALSWTNSTWFEGQSLLRFKLWMDPNLIANSAFLNMYGKNHSTLQRTNNAELQKVTSDWKETVVTWNLKPTFNNTILTDVPATTSTTQNTSNVDISNFWNSWKTNNPTNYGMLFKLDTYAAQYARQEYYSSDETNTALRPSITFNVRAEVLASGTVSAGSTSICSGSTTLLTLSGSTTGSTFQWQKSTDNVTFANISGATSSTYTTLGSTVVNTWYRCVVSLGTCAPKNSGSLLITIKPIPTITVNNPSFCSGNTVTLTATPSIGGGTYLWSTGGTTASIAVAPLVNTNYTVVYTLNGCSSTMQTSSVTVCQQYAKLERILSGINYNVFAQNVNFFFDQEYTSSNTNLTYKIFKVNDRTSPVMTGVSNAKIVVFADNRYKLNVASLNPGIYVLEVKNDKNELFYLRFTK